MNDFLKKMFINEAKPALSRHSGSNVGSSAGGVISIDRLPEQFTYGGRIEYTKGKYDPESYDVVADGEPISFNKIYFNTNLSSEEVIALIRKVTTDIEKIHGLHSINRIYRINFLSENGGVLGYLYFSNPFEFSTWEPTDNFMINTNLPSPLFFIYCDGSDEFVSDHNIKGWSADYLEATDGILELPEGTTYVVPHVYWESDNWEEQFETYGCMSEKIQELSNLISIVPFKEKTPNPDFNSEAVYKLPDETLWLYKDGGWVELKEHVEEEEEEEEEIATDPYENMYMYILYHVPYSDVKFNLDNVQLYNPDNVPIYEVSWDWSNGNGTRKTTLFEGEITNDFIKTLDDDTIGRHPYKYLELWLENPNTLNLFAVKISDLYDNKRPPMFVNIPVTATSEDVDGVVFVVTHIEFSPENFISDYGTSTIQVWEPTNAGFGYSSGLPIADLFFVSKEV